MHAPVARAHPSSLTCRFYKRYSLIACVIALLLSSNLFLFALLPQTSGIGSTGQVDASALPYIACVLNGILALLYIVIRREYVLPAHRILEESSKLRGHAPDIQNISFRHTALEFSRFVDNALTIADDRNQLLSELNDAHNRIRLLMHGQQGLCNQTLKESQHLFSTVDAYADYLEELVASDLVKDGVRYDYDEVLDASHNLRFLIQGMLSVVQIETQSRPLKHNRTDIALLLGRYLMHLTPALERRAMRFSSANCAETLPIRCDEALLGHVLWALLTSCLHYAEEDSCLNIEGFATSDDVQLRFYVTVSSPSTLSKRERDAYLNALASMAEQVHMFSHTMQQYPNMQLASRLAQALGGHVECVPEGDYRCVLALRLPHLR